MQPIEGAYMSGSQPTPSYERIGCGQDKPGLKASAKAHAFMVIGGGVRREKNPSQRGTSGVRRRKTRLGGFLGNGGKREQGVRRAGGQPKSEQQYRLSKAGG